MQYPDTYSNGNIVQLSALRIRTNREIKNLIFLCELIHITHTQLAI